MVKWITATEITAWVKRDSRRAQEKLPELVRKLIQATASSIDRINFPCDGSVTSGGWDGHLETKAKTPFFPSGLSKWEMGVGESCGNKADSDYKSRTADPLDAVPADTVYVQVSPQPWIDRDNWVKAKKTEDIWKDVRAIGADDLELWLESAPAVALWLAKEMKKIGSAIRDIEAWWEYWSTMTNPFLSVDLVISGRQDEVNEIHGWYRNGPNIFEMQGDDAQEPFAFLYSALSKLPEEECQRAFSRCVVVETIEQLRDCYESFVHPLIIAVPAECIEEAHMAVNKGHHVFVSANAMDRYRYVHKLSRAKREPMQEALEKLGLSEADATRCIRNTGRSIPVIRRQRFKASNKTPEWAKQENSKFLLPALLAGAWTDGREGDKEMMEALSGMPYSKFSKSIKPLTKVEDSPLIKVGHVWMLKSPLDAWFLAAQYLDQDDFTNFRRGLSAVLTETDPKYDLPSSERWMAGVKGKTPKCSRWVRRGLVESLVLLSVYGDKISEEINSPEDFAYSVVKDLLDAANTWEAWATLKDVMPLLAEASPDAFIDVLDEKIDSEKEIFVELMKDDEDRFGFGDCRHSGLLWALESIAWDPEYVTAASMALLKLAQIDPGGRWSNRPLASLTDILLPALPQTYANAKQRVKVYKKIIKEDAVIAWQLASSHMGGGTVSPSHSFQWRDMGGDRGALQQVSSEDYTEYLKSMFPIWADLVCVNNSTVSSGIEDFIRLPEEIRKSLVKKLDQLDKKSFSIEERKVILQHLRHTLNWILNYDKEENYKKHVPALRRAYNLLTPEDPLDRIDWLFQDGWPDLPEATKRHDQQERLEELRIEAAKMLLEEVSLGAIGKYGSGLNYQAAFGSAFAKAEGKKHDPGIVSEFSKYVKESPWLLVGYAMGLFDSGGQKAVLGQIEVVEAGKLKSQEKIIASLLRGLPEQSDTWSIVESYGDRVGKEYWLLASGYTRRDDQKKHDAEYAVKKLIDVGRPGVAVRIAGDSHGSLPSALLKQVLLELLNLSVEDKNMIDGSMLEFYLSNIFDQLYKNDDLTLEEIGALEWPYAQIFDHHHKRTKSPMALHQNLQSNPGFFVELLSYLYKKDDGSNSKPDNLSKKQAENIAKNAYEVLHTWSLVPGVSSSGEVDKEVLREWVITARKMAKEQSYLKGCDLKLAEILSKMPQDSDGVWPHVALRDLLEEVKSSILDKHIPFAIYNSRGVRSKSLTDGGSEERRLADKYMAWSKELSDNWPRTSRVLKNLSTMFSRDAEREDIDSQLHDLEY